uniref:C-type lectin domain-containing protein n=1 Tax=Xiphophorus couchianus TaxID=32473 RepID=A0A3B5LL50_9TELE
MRERDKEKDDESGVCVLDVEHHIKDCNVPKDFKKLKEICYNRLSWSDAQTYCRQNFRDLATIRNHTENQRAQSLLPSPAFVWIGLFRDPNFHWSDGSRFVYRNWADVFNVIGSNRIICGVTWSPGQWRFRSCETKRSFVCHSLPGKCLNGIYLLMCM